MSEEQTVEALLIELADRFDRGELIGGTPYAGRCAMALRAVVKNRAPAGDAGAEPTAWTGSGSLRAVELGIEGHIYGTSAPAHPIPLYAAPPPAWRPDREAVISAIKSHVYADATGLAPAVIGHHLYGFEDAADAILALGAK